MDPAKAAFTDYAYLPAEIRLSFDCIHLSFFAVTLKKICVFPSVNTRDRLKPLDSLQVGHSINFSITSCFSYV